jgi:AAA+ ATPase superfamily predicted ATPase
MNSLSPLQIYNITEATKLREFVELASNGKRPDGTYNYCREALEKKAQQLLEELKEIKQDGLRNLC